MTEIPNLIGLNRMQKKSLSRIKGGQVLEQSSCAFQVRQEIEIEKEIEIEQEKRERRERQLQHSLPTLNAYGKFKNVRLSDKDYEELQEVFGSQVTEKLIICPHTWKEQYLSPYPIL